MQSFLPTARIWGTRGSIPCTGSQFLRYGGHTTCIEFQLGAMHSIVIDAGSGLLDLIKDLNARPKGFRIDLFLSHLHLDHIIALGMIPDDLDVTLWSERRPDDLKTALRRLFSPPIWPVDLFEKNIKAHQFGSGVNSFGHALVSCFPLNHPGDCTGFQIQLPGVRVCTVLDHEHGVPEIDQAVLKAVTGADFMFYDAAYTEDQYPNHIGWGHSTAQKALELSQAAGVGNCFLMHHGPDASDTELDARAAQLAGAAHMVRQGDEIKLCPATKI